MAYGRDGNNFFNIIKIVIFKTNVFLDKQTTSLIYKIFIIYTVQKNLLNRFILLKWKSLILEPQELKKKQIYFNIMSNQTIITKYFIYMNHREVFIAQINYLLPSNGSKLLLKFI